MKICLLGDARSIHLQRISRGLAQRDVRVHVVTHKPAEIGGVSVERYRVPPPGIMNPHRWSARRRRYLCGLARDFDVVHVHFLQDWGFTPEIMAKGSFAVTPWGSDITPPPGEGLPGDELTAARRSLLQQADLITAMGPRFAQSIAQFGAVSRNRIKIIPLGVDVRLFRRGAPWERTAVGSSAVGFFKGFRVVYGASVLVQAIPRIVSAVPKVRFRMIGDGAEKADCQRLAMELDVNRCIDWIPRQEHADLPAFLREWDVSVIPSLQESFGVAALESSAMELPVAASDVGGLPDTVRDGETGVLVPPGDPAALADAIVTLLRDSALRQRMGCAGRERVEREFDWDFIMDEWVNTYARLRENRCVMV